MEHEIKHPLKVGQQAEVRTFEKGYRGAWFRCKIRKISRKKGTLGHVLEYDDFPDEKLAWTPLYQKAIHSKGNIEEKHRELMLRPPYPPIYNEKKMLHVSEISEVTVIGGDSWRVGDLVDWWTTGCYWSGRITQLLGDNEAKIQLKPPPLGEGLSYKVLLKDLRPSLDWSPELGWTIPTQEGGTGRPCARLVKPINQGMNQQQATTETEAGPSSAGSFISSPVSSNSAVLDEAKSRTETEMKTSFPEKRFFKKQRDKKETRLVDASTRKTSRVVADSGQNGAEPAAVNAEDKLSPDYFQKKYKASGRPILHSNRSDLIEAPILDLEEYLNKVKWLKNLLQHGISSSSHAQGPQWEVLK